MVECTNCVIEISDLRCRVQGADVNLILRTARTRALLLTPDGREAGSIPRLLVADASGSERGREEGTRGAHIR
jgi:hypothetical protein